MSALIIEDETTSQLVLHDFISRMMNCDLAKNAWEGIRYFETAYEEDRPYRLVTLDIVMPNVDGHQALHRLREIEEERGIPFGSGAKVLMVSAHSDIRNVAQAFRGLCDGFLEKPVSEESLRSTLQKLLGDA